MRSDFGSRLDVEYDGELPASVDRSALNRMATVAYVLDESVRIPGIGYRVGVDPVLGVLPVAGDVVSAGFSLYIVAESAYLGVSFTTLVRMLANITADVASGSVPVVGTLIDAVWKANKRNVELAAQDLAEPVETDGGSDVDGIEIPVEDQG
jgi:hypothetical protein